MVYDCAVIGGGPAGVSAAINLKILNKEFIWLTCGVSKKAAAAEIVRNYPGFLNVTGQELVEAFSRHAEDMGIESRDELVTAVYDLGGRFAVAAGQNTYECRTIILCTGASVSKPIEGEEFFLGRGVSYCATCDGFLYKDKTIAVLSTDKRFEHEIKYLCSLAGKVYLMPMYKDCEVDLKNCEIVKRMPKEIKGGMKMEKIIFQDGELDADGFFILRSFVSPSILLRGLDTDGGHIAVDRQCRTGIEGVFAAGDCTGRPYQYAKAVGEGNVAAHAAVEYISGEKI